MFERGAKLKLNARCPHCGFHQRRHIRINRAQHLIKQIYHRGFNSKFPKRFCHFDANIARANHYRGLGPLFANIILDRQPIAQRPQPKHARQINPRNGWTTNTRARRQHQMIIMIVKCAPVLQIAHRNPSGSRINLQHLVFGMHRNAVFGELLRGAGDQTRMICHPAAD